MIDKIRNVTYDKQGDQRNKTSVEGDPGIGESKKCFKITMLPVLKKRAKCGGNGEKRRYLKMN